MYIWTSALVATAALAPLPAAAAETPVTTYTAVIDAGSSGSRIYLYEGTSGSDSVSVQPRFEAKVEPGLSSYASNPSKAGPQGIAPLLTQLDTYLAANVIDPGSITVHVLATAGMRNVQRIEPRAVRSIYHSARQTVSESGLRVGRVGTISGTTEGLYSWVDVNYLRGLFGADATPRGIVEVGGASAQVAFRTTASNPSPNVVSAKVAGRTYRVFSVSYLGLGQNDARQSILNPSDAQAGSPCFPNNPRGERPRRYTLDNAVSVLAARSEFSLDACSARSAATISRVASNRYNGRHTHGATMASIRSTPGFERTHFLGLSSIAFSMSDFGVPARQEARRMGKAIRTTCSGVNAWPRVRSTFGGKVTAFAENGCVNGTFLHTFTFESAGLGVASNRFRAATKVAGESPTWTRGFAVLQASR